MLVFINAIERGIQNEEVCQSPAGADDGAGHDRSGGGKQDQLARIQEKGEIVIATEGTWAPWTYTDENGNLVGFDVEIATAIAEKLGVKATFVTVEWDGILAGIDSGRYDIAANGIDVTEQRSEKYNFSTPMPSTARRWSSGATTRTSSPLKT